MSLLRKILLLLIKYDVIHFLFIGALILFVVATPQKLVKRKVLRILYLKPGAYAILTRHSPFPTGDKPFLVGI